MQLKDNQDAVEFKYSHLIIITEMRRKIVK
jgi:hypothetical protein